jgi:hypothetical protein
LSSASKQRRSIATSQQETQFEVECAWMQLFNVLFAKPNFDSKRAKRKGQTGEKDSGRPKS